MNLFRVALIGLLVQGLSAQQPPTLFVSGVVLRSADGVPIAHASVELRRNEAPAATYALTTADDGSFQVSGILPGKYRLLATRNGFLPAEYGQSYPGGPALTITVGGNRQTTKFSLAMVQTATMLGRVSTPGGQPLVNATVSVMRASYDPFGRRLTIVQSTRTNDLGEFRVFWMPPGQYYVSAIPWDGDPASSTLVLNAGAPRNNLAAPTGTAFSMLPGDRPFPGFHPDDGRSESEAWLPTYFGGTTDENRATRIDVSAGATVRGIDIMVSPVRPRRLTGIVVDAETRRPVSKGRILQLHVPASGGFPPVDDLKSNGAFDLRGVTPGAIALIALVGNADDRPTAPPSRWGRISVDVRDRDLDNLIIPVSGGVDVRGRVVFEGWSGDHPDEMAELSVSLQDSIFASIGGLGANPAPDGTFTVQGVPSADYRVTVKPFQRPPSGRLFAGPPPPPPSPPPPGTGNSPGGLIGPPTQEDDVSLPQLLRKAYLKRIRLGDVDLLGRLLHVDDRLEGQLEIVIGTDGGGLDGVVSNNRNDPVVNVSVLLIPSESLSGRTDLIRVAHTDESGKYSFDGVMPGDYRVFVLAGVEEGAWYSEEFRQSYADRGTVIRIEPGSRRTMNLR